MHDSKILTVVIRVALDTSCPGRPLARIRRVESIVMLYFICDFMMAFEAAE